MRLGIIGFGNIAVSLLKLIAEGEEPLDHVAVLCRSEHSDAVRGRFEGDLKGIAHNYTVVTDGDGLRAQRCDLVVECASHSAVGAFVAGLLAAGLTVVVVSVGALADKGLEDELRQAAIRGGGQLLVPSGAVGGVDLLAALAAAGDLEVRYRGIKPPAAWRGTAAATAVNLDELSSPSVFFSGSARDAANQYPKNANVAATLALAAGGFRHIRVDLVADPGASGNVHEYEAVSPLAQVSVRIENRASGGNVKTSVATIYSVLREVCNRQAPMVI